MSRVGKKIITVPGQVKVNVAGQSIEVSGPKGKLSFAFGDKVNVTFDEQDKSITVTRDGDERRAKAMHGTCRAVVANMVHGVSEGFQKRLLIFGTGYGCNLAGRKLQLNCGFMGRGGKNKYQFELDVPEGLEVVVETPAARGDSDPAKLLIRGCDRQQVGQFAAEIRRIRPPEPYKGKGIRYDDEVVRRKVGKALAGAS